MRLEWKPDSLTNIIFSPSFGYSSSDSWSRSLSAAFNENPFDYEKDYEKQIETLMLFYIEHTKYTEEEIIENIQTDWYIRIDEALEKGMVDEVITDIDILC
jgi:hypothetical protein